MEFAIGFQPSQRIFALPCEAADSYIKEADGPELKVLLFVYRHGSPVESGLMARELGLHDEQVRQALHFWAERGLFRCEDAEKAPAAAKAAKEEDAAGRTPSPAPAAPKPEAPRAAPGRVVSAPVAYSAGEVARKVKEDEGIRFVLETVPSLLGRLLSPAECSALINLYEDAGLPADVILMAVEYCVTNGRTNFRYIEKLSLGWAEDGVTTHEAAEARIRQLEARHSFEGKVRTLTGAGSRALTPKERTAIDRWADWELPEELIAEAYEICVARTGKLSLSYMNSILTAWHDKGIRTAQQAREEARRGGKAGQTEHRGVSFDVGEYVDLSMKRLLKE